ncbi:MAG: hypothetical protein GY755_14305 [Chloroflexi bacterium]|nr:hypothetical protein [Chloroflexota bacterium]
MEKIKLVFLILLYNKTVQIFFWMTVCFATALWHTFYFPYSKRRSESDLVEISDKFEGINADYSGAVGAGMVGIMLILGLTDRTISFIDIVLFFGVYGILQAVFALVKGVYPMGKQMAYVYDDEAIIRKIAIYQISISIVVIVSAMIFVN